MSGCDDKNDDKEPAANGCTPIPGTGYCIPSPNIYHSNSPAPVISRHGGDTEPATTDGGAEGEDDNDSSQTVILLRKLSAEFTGTAALVFIVVGSGIHATLLTDDVGLQLTMNSIATAFGLYGLITIFGPVSGAHFNPIVSLVDVLYQDMTVAQLGLYVPCQVLGAMVGCILANVIFELETQISSTERWGYHLWISEIIAAASLIVVIHGCIRTGEKASVPTAVAAWVGGGYFFTSSTIFANPAVTIGRVFTESFAGIDPASMALYIVFQIIGAVLGWLATQWFYPKTPTKPRKEDPLYKRVCIMVDKDFYEKGAY